MYTRIVKKKKFNYIQNLNKKKKKKPLKNLMPIDGDY